MGYGLWYPSYNHKKGLYPNLWGFMWVKQWPSHPWLEMIHGDLQGGLWFFMDTPFHEVSQNEGSPKIIQVIRPF